MNKKSHKKKKRRGKGSDGTRNKENIDYIEEAPNLNDKDVEDDTKLDNKLCYEIKTSDVMGRYLVASRDIKAGEVIIETPALAVGPCAGCGIVCLGCYRELDEDNIAKCKGCEWPLCSASCPGVGEYTGHSRHECDTLRRVTPPDYTELDKLRELYHALMPLRCLLLKSHAPDKWTAVSGMESHNALRRARGDIYPLNQALVVDVLRSWGLDYEDEEVHTVCGILEVNAFEVGSSGSSGVGGSARALYGDAYLLAHSCVPSTTHTDNPRRRARPLTVRAAVPHAPGDLITLCYAYTLQGTLKRREHIEHSKFFECTCARCSDPTELGTCASAFRCPRCAGRVLSAAPLQSRAAWHCTDPACRYTMPADHVVLLLKRVTDELDQIDANDVKGFETFLHKYRNVLHNTHYLCLSAKHSLSQLYGKVSEYMIGEMSREELERKVQICRDLLAVFDVIEPGLSRLRGITLYELHAPLMILTTRDFEKKVITKDFLRVRLKEIVSLLRESAEILSFEPAHSAEGLMAAAARDALTKISTWEQIIGKIS